MARSFGASTDRINIPDDAAIKFGATSFSILITVTPNNSNQNGWIITKRKGTSPFEWYGIAISGNSSFGASGKKILAWIKSTCANFRKTITIADFADGNKHTICAVFDTVADNATLVIDGIEVAQTKTSGGSYPNTDHTEDLSFGNNHNGTFGTNLDSLAETALYNGVLDSNATTAHANGVRVSRIRSDLRVFYMPISGNSSPEADLSGNGNNGTVTGTTKVDHPPVGFYLPMQRFHRIIVSAGGTIQVLKSVIIKHNIKTAITKNTILKQNLKSSVQKLTTIKHQIIEAIKKQITVKQNILAPTTSFLLLEDGVSFLLLEDDTSKLLLESSPNIIQVLKQIILKHNIVASINKNTIIKQNLSTAIQKLIILKHNLKSAITKLIIIKQSILPTLVHPFEVVSNPDLWEDTTWGDGDRDLINELNTNDDDASAIKSPNGSSGTSTVIFKVQPMVDPLSSTGHKLRIRSRANLSIIAMDLFLKQGSATIVSVGDLVVNGYITNEVTLSGAEADSITDYSDLTFELRASYLGIDALIVSFIEFEVPPTQLRAKITTIIKHNIITTTNKSTIIKQNISSNIQKLIIIKQNLISAILKSVIIKQNTIQSILKSTIIKQIINGGIQKLIILKQNIIAPTNKSTIVKQNLRTFTNKQVILKQNIRTNIQKSVIIKQNLKSSVQKLVIIKQNVIEAIIQEIIIKHDILGSTIKVLKSIILKQNIIAPTTKSTIIKFNIRTVSQKLTIIKQNLRNAITKSLTIKQNVRNSILKEIIIKQQIVSSIQKLFIIKHNLGVVISNSRKILGTFKSNDVIKGQLKSFLDIKKGLRS